MKLLRSADGDENIEALVAPGGTRILIPTEVPVGGTVLPWMTKVIDPTSAATDHDGSAGAPYLTGQAAVDANVDALLAWWAGFNVGGTETITLPDNYVLLATGAINATTINLGGNCQCLIEATVIPNGLEFVAGVEDGGAVGLTCGNATVVGITAAETDFTCSSNGTGQALVGNLVCQNAYLTNCVVGSGQPLSVNGDVLMTGGAFTPSPATATIGGILTLRDVDSAGISSASVWTVETMHVYGGGWFFGLNASLTLTGVSNPNIFEGVTIGAAGGLTFVTASVTHFRSCIFTAAVLIDNAGGLLTWDAASWQSFVALGGTVTTPANSQVLGAPNSQSDNGSLAGAPVGVKDDWVLCQQLSLTGRRICMATVNFVPATGASAGSIQCELLVNGVVKKDTGTIVLPIAGAGVVRQVVPMIYCGTDATGNVDVTVRTTIVNGGDPTATVDVNVDLVTQEG